MTLLAGYRSLMSKKGNLLAVARQGRLIREERDGPRRVALTPIDEDALDLIDRSLERRVTVHFLYPAPAGQVSVLLAAQVLIHQLVIHQLVKGLPSKPDFVVGLVTADVAEAIRTWCDLRIATTGLREAINDVFPYHRTGPNGEAPPSVSTGLVVGHRFTDWPVNLTIIDHSAGPVDGSPPPPAVHLFVDPLDPFLERVSRSDELIWTWSPCEFAVGTLTDDSPALPTIPFSVAASRLRTIDHGMKFTIRSFRSPDAERAMRNVREDLRQLRATMEQSGNTRPLQRGLQVASHRLLTLTSLPCAPSQFDRFSGLPPWAARPTESFAGEIAAWARTLPDASQDYAAVLASDLEDLRVSLEHAPPFVDALSCAAGESPEKLVVVRSRTAARALIDVLGGHPDSGRVGSLVVRPISSLHRERAWDQVIVVGIPPRWQWHRLDSGLSQDVQILALGSEQAWDAYRSITDLARARSYWASEETRGKAWALLVGDGIPTFPEDSWASRYQIVLPEGEPVEVPRDPFDALATLLASEPLAVGEEDLEVELARRTESAEWSAVVQAVEIVTDQGTIKLEVGRPVEVRVGTKIHEVPAEDLQPGMRVLIGRTNRRLGLLEALEEHLVSRRPDLLAVRLLIETFSEMVRSAFEQSGLSVGDLYQRLRALGCDKTLQTVRGWVTQGGPRAPRDPSDVKRLEQALDLQLGSRRLTETVAALRRWRGLRRTAGKLLAEAAVVSTVARSEAEIDKELGLSVAELRESVVEAIVHSVAKCSDPVSFSEIGRLE